MKIKKRKKKSSKPWIETAIYIFMTAIILGAYIVDNGREGAVPAVTFFILGTALTPLIRGWRE